MPVMRLVILLVAMGAAIGAALLVRSMQNAPVPVQPIQTIEKVVTQTLQNVEPERRVLVAVEDLRVGQYLIPEHFAWQPWVGDGELPSFFVDEVQPNAVDDLIGAVVRTDMLAGEPFTPNKIAHPGTAGFMSAVLTPGMRAVAVEISSESAAGGFIFPDDRVDIVMVHNQIGPTGKTSKAVDTVLHNVRVLAIDGFYRPVQEGEGRVLTGSRATLELTKEDAIILMHAEEKGSLSLVLRSVGETDSPSGSTARSRALARGDVIAKGVRVFAGGGGGGAVGARAGAGGAAGYGGSGFETREAAGVTSAAVQDEATNAAPSRPASNRY